MSCHVMPSSQITRVKSQQPPRSSLATTTRPYEACVWNLAAAIAPLKKRRWGDVHVRSTRFNQWQGLPPWSHGEWFETAAVQWHLPNLFGRSVAWHSSPFQHWKPWHDYTILYITHMEASKIHKRGAKIDSCWFRLWLNWVSSRIEKIGQQLRDLRFHLQLGHNAVPNLFRWYAHFHKCCLSTQCFLISAGYIPFFHQCPTKTGWLYCISYYYRWTTTKI